MYGHLAIGKTFTNRETETKLLSSNFQNGLSTVLISPRRWGKSSLVQKAAEVAMANDKHLKVCFLDLFNIRSEEQFYEYMASEVIKSVSGKLEEITENAKRFLGKFIPKISMSLEANSEVSLGLNWNEVKKSPDEILDLAEKLAMEKGISFRT